MVERVKSLAAGPCVNGRLAVSLLSLSLLVAAQAFTNLTPRPISLHSCPDGQSFNNTFLYTVYGGTPNSVVKPPGDYGLFHPILWDEGRKRIVFAEYYNGGPIPGVPNFSNLRDLNAEGKVSTIGGGGGFGYTGDGILATDPTVRLTTVSSIALHPGNGDILFLDQGVHRVRRINGTTRMLTTVVGSGATRITGDGGPPLLAGFPNPYGFFWDTDANRIVAAMGSSGNVLRLVDLNPNGTISTIAGSPGVAGYFDGPSPLTSLFNLPFAVLHRRLNATAPSNSILPGSASSFELVVCDRENHAVRVVSAAGAVTTFVGAPAAGPSKGAYSALELPSERMPLKQPTDAAWDEDNGVLYIAENGASVLRVVVPPEGLSKEERTRTPLDAMKATNKLGVLGGVANADNTYIVPNAQEGVVALESPMKPLRLTYSSPRALLMFTDAAIRAIRGVTCRRKRRTVGDDVALLQPQQRFQRDYDDGIIPPGYYLNLTDNSLRECGFLLSRPAWAAALVPGLVAANITAQPPSDICCPPNLGAIHHMGGWATFSDLPRPCYDGGCSFNGTCVPGLEPTAAAKEALALWSAAQGASNTPPPLPSAPFAALVSPGAACPKGYFCIPSFASTNSSDSSDAALAVRLTAVPCPRGTLCNIFNLTAPLSCPQGHVCASPASNPQVCPAGSVCPDAPFSMTNMTLCPKGVFCPAGTVLSPQRCPRGTYNDKAGQALLDSCLPCPVNTYAPTSGNEGPAACLPCPAGTKTLHTGRQSSADCIDLRQLFSDLSAFANASATAPATTTVVVSSTGAGIVTSSSDFVQEPKEHICEPGTQPRGSSASVPRSQADCVPLNCEKAGLFPAPDNRTCIGCPPGTTGKPPPYGVCSRPAECSASGSSATSSLCVGFASKPLPSVGKLFSLTSQLSSLAGSPGGAGPSRRSLAASNLSPQCAALAQELALYQQPGSTGTAGAIPASSASPDASVISKARAAANVVGIVFSVVCALILAISVCAMSGRWDNNLGAEIAVTTLAAGSIGRKRAPLSSIPSPLHGGGGGSSKEPGKAEPASAAKTGVASTKKGVAAAFAWVLRMLRALDLLGLVGPNRGTDGNVDDDDDDFGSDTLQKRSPIGGCVCLLSSLLVLCLWLVLIVDNAILSARNPVTVSSLQPLTGSAADLLNPLPAAASGLSGSNSLPVKGLRMLLVSGVGENGACASNMRWSNSTGAGGFAASTMVCADLAAHSFSCPDCSLSSPGASLSVSLDWSCQSVIISSLAVGADGAVTTRVASASAMVVEPSGVNATASVALLSSMTLQLEPLLQVQPSQSRGYALLPPSSSSLVIARSEIAGSSFLPAKSSVELTVDLNPMPFVQTLSVVDVSTASSSALEVFCAMMGLMAGVLMLALACLRCLRVTFGSGIPFLPLAFGLTHSLHANSRSTSYLASLSAGTAKTASSLSPTRKIRSPFGSFMTKGGSGFASFFSPALRTDTGASVGSHFGGRTTSDMRKGAQLATPSAQRLDAALNQLNTRAAALAKPQKLPSPKNDSRHKPPPLKAFPATAVAASPFLHTSSGGTMAIPPSLPHASYYYRGAAGLGSGGNQNAVSQLSKAPGAGANAYTSEATRSSWAYRLAIQNNASAQDAKDNGEEIAVDEAGATSAMDAKVKLMRLGSVSGGNLAITAAAAEDRRASPLGDEGSDDAEGDYDEDDNEGSGEAVVYHERRGYGTQGSRDSDVPTASSVTATGAGGLRSTRIDDDGNP